MNIITVLVVGYKCGGDHRNDDGCDGVATTPTTAAAASTTIWQQQRWRQRQRRYFKTTTSKTAKIHKWMDLWISRAGLKVIEIIVCSCVEYSKVSVVHKQSNMHLHVPHSHDARCERWFLTREITSSPQHSMQPKSNLHFYTPFATVIDATMESRSFIVKMQMNPTGDDTRTHTDIHIRI